MPRKIYARLQVEDDDVVLELRGSGFVDVHFDVVVDQGGIFLQDGEEVAIWLAANMARAMLAELTRAVSELPTTTRT
jgi:hypothetical protein